VTAHGVRRTIAGHDALAGVDLTIGDGRVVGIIGPNGAGKTTLLQAMVGLVPVQGELRVLGHEPWRHRQTLLRHVSYVADVSIMPRWLRVSSAVDYYAGVHPAFDRSITHELLARADIEPRARVGALSKGQAAQVQLSLAMGVDARLMVLDEPTLGLDILYRKRFFDMLLTRFAEQRQTVVIATHDVDEIQHVLTDLVFMDAGRVTFQCTTEEYEQRFVEVHVHPEHVEIARTMGPMHERPALAGRVMIFDNADRSRLSLLGDLRRPGIAALFAAVVGEGGEAA
jgi:ABC-2 type transport system ATP-binding protein